MLTLMMPPDDGTGTAQTWQPLMCKTTVALLSSSIPRSVIDSCVLKLLALLALLADISRWFESLGAARLGQMSSRNMLEAKWLDPKLLRIFRVRVSPFPPPGDFFGLAKLSQSFAVKTTPPVMPP